jgi:hypothetical protein
MAINVAAPKTVQAGEPITAQGWNTLGTAITTVIQFLNDSEASSLRVSITNSGVTNARVSVIRDDSVTFDAVAPVPPGTEYIFSGLRAGGYKLRAEAAGFAPKVSDVTVPAPATIQVTLDSSGGIMPALFGSTLRAALTELANRGILVSRVLDVVGRDVAPANPPAQNTESLVLAQVPSAGEAVPPNGQVQLVISAALQVEPAIEVPSLAGLTLPEAQKALEGIGLVLGKVTTLQPKV